MTRSREIIATTVVGKWTMKFNHFRVRTKGNVYWSTLRKGACEWIKRRRSDMSVERTWRINDSDIMVDSYLRINTKKSWRQMKENRRSMILIANVRPEVKWFSRLSVTRDQPVLAAQTVPLGKPLVKWAWVPKDKIELKHRPIWTCSDPLYNRKASLWQLEFKEVAYSNLESWVASKIWSHQFYSLRPSLI